MPGDPTPSCGQAGWPECEVRADVPCGAYRLGFDDVELYLVVNRSQTTRPMAAGSRISAQFRQKIRSRSLARGCGCASLRSDADSRLRKLEGKPRMARTISSFPLRSAIRMVAELMPLVDCSSFLRKGGGTSWTERNTSVRPPTEMKMVEL